MLRKLRIILVFAILAIAICSKVSAEETQTQTYTSTTSDESGIEINWSYSLNDSNEIEDLRCTNKSSINGNIKIPSTIDGYTVIGLGSSAFRGATNMTGIDLGTITKIGDYAFSDCTSLKSITIPKTLVEVNGNGVLYPIFGGTTNLTSVTFEEGITEIPSRILVGCTGITNVTIPNSVSVIGSYAFYKTGLTSIELPDSVVEVKDYAFAGCDNLTDVNLGKIEILEFRAFHDCPKLKSITIPKTLCADTLGNAIFTGTTKLTSVTFEDGSTDIYGGILAKCTEIKSVDIPNTVTTIHRNAFSGSGITSIEIPESVTLIAQGAFADCTDLTKITILENCTTIVEDAFDNHNENLTIYCYEGSVAAQYAIDHQIKYVYLNDSDIDDDKEEDNTGNTGNTENTDKPNDEVQNDSIQKPSNIETNTTNSNINTDTTVASGKLPYTGVDINYYIPALIAIALISIIIIYRYYRMGKKS